MLLGVEAIVQLAVGLDVVHVEGVVHAVVVEQDPDVEAVARRTSQPELDVLMPVREYLLSLGSERIKVVDDVELWTK